MFLLLLRGWRSWKSAKGVALLAIAALAIGIGSATAIYSVVQTVLLTPLPFANPERYLSIRGEYRAKAGLWTSFSYPDSQDFSARLRTVEAFGCTTGSMFIVASGGQLLNSGGAEVSAGILNALGVAPVMGRWFQEKDPAVGVAVISARLWKRLGADPGIVGKPITLNGKPHRVVGVAPAWFHYPLAQSRDEVWTPLNPDAKARAARTSHYLQCVAKVKSGFTAQQVREDAQGVLNALGHEHPGQAEPDVITATPLLREVVRLIRPTLLVLMAAAMALLFITCANVASLLLARSVARARETAVRVALGATAWQLALQYFSEGLAVSLAGAAAGTLFSWSLVRLVLRLAADYIPRADQVGFNGPVLGFTLGMAVLCGILFSLSPLWQAVHTQPQEVLSEGVRASAGARSRGLLRVFVVAEIALAFGLVAAGGLLLQELHILYRVPTGFDPDDLLVGDAYAPSANYSDAAAQTAYETRLVESISKVPGVDSAGFISRMPLVDAGWNTLVQVEGRPLQDWRITKSLESVEQRVVSPGYFGAMKIPLIRGRWLNQRDRIQPLAPILINQTFAHLYWPGSSPLGAHLIPFGWDIRFEVVGVVGDVRNFGLNEPVHPEFYISYQGLGTTHMAWAMRSRLDEATATRELRRAVESVDPAESMFNVRSMGQVIDESVSTDRLQSLMVSFFAVAALLLAMLGVYGVMAYGVRQRTTEMGTRMAVGALPGDLLRMVMADGLKMALAGIAAGLIVVFAVARLLAAGDFSVRISGPWPLAAATFLIAAFTLFACWFPAWRATLVSPMAAIRNESGSAWQQTRMGYRALAGRVGELVTGGEAPRSQENELLARIAGAGRKADSFAEAARASLEVLRDGVQAESAILLAQRAAGQPYRVAAAAWSVPHVEDPWTLRADALLVGRLRHLGAALPVTAADLASWRRWAVDEAPERLQEIAVLEELGVSLAVAVVCEDEIAGLLLLGRPTGRAQYRDIERRALPGVAAQMGLILENGRLVERIFEQERFRREMLVATEVQKRLFPQGPPEAAGLQLAGVCLPARGVGGDYYDFLDLGNRQTGIALADVAGKGIAAALIMSVVQASLRSLAGSNGASLAELAGKMNRLLHRSTGSSSYATFFYAQFDGERRRLRYVNAGHNPPFLLRCREAGTDAPLEELPAGGTIIGMFPHSSYEESVLELESGDVLMLFSDGVPEAQDPREEEFGEDRLRDLLRRTAGLPVSEMATAILGELKTWMSDAAQYDDLTFVLLKVQ